MNSTTRTLDELLRHERFVQRLARSLLATQDDADDLVQETWLRVVQHPPDSSGHAVGWLGTVMRNLAQNVRIGASRRDKREAASARTEATPPLQQVIERQEAQRHVVSALSRLPEAQASAIVLRFFDGLPPREIARRLSVPVETVKKRLTRGLAELREELDGTFEGGRAGWTAALPLLVAVPAGSSAPAAAATLPAIALDLLMSTTARVVCALAIVAIGAMFVARAVGRPEAPPPTAHRPSAPKGEAADAPARVMTPIAPRPFQETEEAAQKVAPIRVEVVDETGRGATGRVIVRVVDRQKQPVPGPLGVRLEEIPELGAAPASSPSPDHDRADVQGDVVFEQVAVGTKLKASACVGGRRYMSHTEGEGPRNAGDEVVLTVTIDLGRPFITGRILDSHREPLRQADLKGFMIVTGVPVLNSVTPRTDAAGRFRYEIVEDLVPGGERRMEVGYGIDRGEIDSTAVIDLAKSLQPGDNDVGDVVLVPVRSVFLTAVDADGQLIRSAEAAEIGDSRASPRAWSNTSRADFKDGRVRLLLHGTPVDVIVGAPGFRRKQLTALSSDERVVLDEGIPIRVVLAGDSFHPPDGTSIRVGLEFGEITAGHLAHALPEYLIGRFSGGLLDRVKLAADVFVGEAGRYRLGLFVEAPSKPGVELASRWIEVSEEGPGQVFELTPTSEAVQEVLHRFQGK